MTDIRDLIRRQHDLEDESRALGESRYHARKLPWRSEAGTAEEEANLPPGQKLLQTATLPVAEAFDAFVAEACSGKAGRRHAAADPMLLADTTEASYLVLRVLINGAHWDLSLQALSIMAADALIENIEFTAFRDVNRAGYKGYQKKQERRGYSRQRAAAVKKLLTAEGVALPISQTDKVALGSKLIEIVCETTGLFVVEKQPRSKGYVYVVRPSETLTQWFDKQHARCALLNPLHMPMIVRPRRWRSPFYGGYLTKRPGIKFIKQRNRAYHDEVANMDLDRVYNAVNHIQESPWRINRQVLHVLETLWNGGGGCAGLPSMEGDPVPAKPHDIDTNEEAKAEWKRAAATVHDRNSRTQSARLALHSRIWISRRFMDEDRIYFPHELDFRGRVYPLGAGGPSPQGDDVSKALLEFADGKPLGERGKSWLRIHIANLFGVDKVSFAEREAWVFDNAAKLIDSGLAPLDGERFWMTADSPFMALAACIEFVGMLEQGADFVSHLPIALDGSNSGLQHFSAMLRDPQGARAVNLSPADKPQDVYREVADKAQAIAEATPFLTYTTKVDGEDVEVTIPNPWRDGKVTRSIAKRPTMTFCYSSTRFGMQDMILQTLRQMDWDLQEDGKPPFLGGADNYHAAMWLSHVLFQAISETVEAAAVAMEWLRSVAKVAAGAGLPLWWTTPMGLPILQEYKEQKGTRVKAHWGGRRVDLLVKLETETLDRRSQMNGVAPNFVHSLDAAHLQAVAERAKERGIEHLAVIHDSFGTHACDTDELASILRDTLIEQYTPDVLRSFFEQIKSQLPEDLAEQLPPPPAMGSLDLSDIRKSLYVFA